MSSPLHLKMRDRLAAAQSKRNLLAKWVEHEQRAMLDAVNEERSARGLDLLALADIVRIESMALGHTDYSIKFALYCAEAAEGRRPTP